MCLETRLYALGQQEHTDDKTGIVRECQGTLLQCLLAQVDEMYSKFRGEG